MSGILTHWQVYSTSSSPIDVFFTRLTNNLPYDFIIFPTSFLERLADAQLSCALYGQKARDLTFSGAHAGAFTCSLTLWPGDLAPASAAQVPTTRHHGTTSAAQVPTTPAGTNVTAQCIFVLQLKNSNIPDAHLPEDEGHPSANKGMRTENTGYSDNQLGLSVSGYRVYDLPIRICGQRTNLFNTPSCI